ncbi:hypothetical protein CBR_g38683 [Chara braunii]|uniref:Large ribosomal subunit protein mL54 n=1 Tax=Chara braunii TaxID=69332 RepID=A0A388LQ55_CHABU|nr:hypothetical protein CBR_g38683 [Chara braunii]|eukprot:GBG84401.1 hypothetical protein CBR_g38683 [Chara braunii]
MLRAAGCIRAVRGALRLRAAAPAKGGKKAKEAASGGPPPVSLELRSKFTVGANIMKDGSDPPLKDDSEYPDWLWTLLDKQPTLSELQRKDIDAMEEKEIMRLLKLDNRKKIKEENGLHAKN